MKRTITEEIVGSRKRGVPLVCLETSDQHETIRTISQNDFLQAGTLCKWSVTEGLSPLNEAGRTLIGRLCGKESSAMVTGNPTEMLVIIKNVPENTIVFMTSAHLFIEDATVKVAITNLRDTFKAKGAMLVLTTPSIKLPLELQTDMFMIREALPEESQIKEMAESLLDSVGMKIPEKINKVVDTLVGLPMFSAEQTLSDCLDRVDGKIQLDMERLWTKKCEAVEQTKGLSVWKGDADEVKGCDNALEYFDRLMSSKQYQAIVLID